MSKDKEQKVILFVEDAFSSIAEIWDRIIAEHPHWLPALRATVPEAWDYLSRTQVHAGVLDVMLPSMPGVKDRSEGVYLAAWIRGSDRTDPGVAGLTGKILEDNRPVPLCFLTTRTQARVTGECESLGLRIRSGLSSSSSKKSNDVGQAKPVLFFEKDRTDASSFISWLGAELDA